VKRNRRVSARTRAVEALRKVLEGGRKAGPLVGELSGGLSALDGDLLRELVLGVLRWKLALDAEIASVSRVPLAKLAPNLREILEVGLYQLRHLDRVPPYAAVHEAVEHARGSGGEGAAKLVNGVLRKILLQPAPAEPGPEFVGAGLAPALARHFSHPEFLVRRWLERFGSETTRRILAADNAPPRLDLLTNPRRSSRNVLRGKLQGQGIQTEPSELTPLALTVLVGNPLRSPLHSGGHFSVQDIGSQLLPLLLPEGGLLVDLAAAPGGKSLSAIAHGRMQRAAAVDRSLPRLRLLGENTRRLGFPEIRPVAGDFSALPLSEGRHERVLLDAPCSGTGTLRKNPEIRYRITADAIERLARAQEAALSDAVRLLAPGGVLLYATCSLEEEENERVVERLLERERGVERVPIQAPSGLPAAPGGCLRLFPDDRTDGFTAQLLRRRAGPDGGAPASVH
jgi:16S rRNA (cytosine967-C5)-methyltransferase